MSKKLMTANEALWLSMESRERPMHVATLLIYSLPDGAPDNYLQTLVNDLRDCREFEAPFNKRLMYPLIVQAPPMLGSVTTPIWVEDFDLDMEYHVRHQALPKPGGEKELGGLISNLHSKPMDFARPLWEYHIIEGLENNRFAVYYKMHHALVDGVAGVRMLHASMSSDPTELNTPALWSVGGCEKKPALDGLGARMAKAAKSVLPVTKGLAQVARAAVRSDDPFIRPFQSRKTILNRRIKSQRRFATQQYSFDRIKALSKAADCTVNDIVLALSGGALREFLKDLCALPGEPLTAGIPVSLRNPEDDGNGAALSFIIATLGTNIADPMRRLNAIKRSTQRAKDLLGGMSREAIESFTNVLYSPQLMLSLMGMEGRSAPVFNLTVSNVPGPREKLYLRGAPLEAMYPVSAVTHGQALNITCYSYAGTLTFGFAGCRDTLPRMQRLAVYTGHALEELEKILLPVETRSADAGKRRPRSKQQKVTQLTNDVA